MNKHGTKNNVREGHLSWPERENAEDPLVIAERQKIREKFLQENDHENYRNANLYIVPTCTKCHENGHFTHECMTATNILEKPKENLSNELDGKNEVKSQGKSLGYHEEMSDLMNKIEQQKV